MTDARDTCVFCGKKAEATDLWNGSSLIYRCETGEHSWGVPRGYDPVEFDYVLVGS